MLSAAFTAVSKSLANAGVPVTCTSRSPSLARDLAQRLDRRRHAVAAPRRQRHDVNATSPPADTWPAAAPAPNGTSGASRRAAPRGAAGVGTMRARSAARQPTLAPVDEQHRPQVAAGEALARGSGSPAPTATRPGAGTPGSSRRAASARTARGRRRAAPRRPITTHRERRPVTRAASRLSTSTATRGRASSSARRRARSTSRASAAPSSSSPCASCRRPTARARPRARTRRRAGRCRFIEITRGAAEAVVGAVVGEQAVEGDRGPHHLRGERRGRRVLDAEDVGAGDEDPDRHEIEKAVNLGRDEPLHAHPPSRATTRRPL